MGAGNIVAPMICCLSFPMALAQGQVWLGYLVAQGDM